MKDEHIQFAGSVPLIGGNGGPQRVLQTILGEFCLVGPGVPYEIGMQFCDDLHRKLVPFSVPWHARSIRAHRMPVRGSDSHVVPGFLVEYVDGGALFIPSATAQLMPAVQAFSWMREQLMLAHGPDDVGGEGAGHE